MFYIKSNFSCSSLQRFTEQAERQLKKKKGNKQYLDILHTRRYCGIPVVQNGIIVNTTVMLFEYKVFCRYWGGEKKNKPKNYLTKTAQNSLEESYMY